MSSNINVIWKPQEGSQKAFLECPVKEVLYHGTRGGGKTDALLMSYLQHVGKGYGSDWRGIIFRRYYPELGFIISQSKKWFYRIFPEAKYNEASHKWLFPGGESLIFRHIAKSSDVDKHQGQEYVFIGWEELTNWIDLTAYKAMFACLRSTNEHVPKMVRATTNPSGVGHNLVKDRFKLPHVNGRMVGEHIKTGNIDRISIFSDVRENKKLLESQPDYLTLIESSSEGNEARRRAWLYGDWNIVAGGMFDDVWSERAKYIVIPRFIVPKGWKIYRSFDWGSSKPFSVGWWTISDGSDIKLNNGKYMSTLPGDIFRIFEYYGCGKTPNSGVQMLARDIARRILEIEKNQGFDNVIGGIADSSIFTVENNHCIASDFRDEGVFFTPCIKGQGSRINGWEKLRSLMMGSHNPYGIREDKGLFICENCKDWIRTIPVLPRDEKILDDVDTNAEDHCADETRYFITYNRPIEAKKLGMIY